jgi:hypothetical protein
MIARNIKRLDVNSLFRGKQGIRAGEQGIRSIGHCCLSLQGDARCECLTGMIGRFLQLSRQFLFAPERSSGGALVAQKTVERPHGISYALVFRPKAGSRSFGSTMPMPLSAMAEGS